jgi:hypothetical protein
MAQTITHSARLSPLQAETVWTLEGGEIVERRGGRARRFELAQAKALHASATGMVVSFPGRRLAIPALSYGGGLRALGHTDSFEPFQAALTLALRDAAPAARLRPAGPSLLAPVLWIMGLIGAGVLGMLAFAAASGSWTLGVTLSARLAFVLILTGAILPWLTRRPR